MCECVCVYHHTSCHIPRLYVENKVLLSFLWRSQDMYCVDLVGNALFKSSGDICWSPLPSSLLDELLVNKRDSDGFFSRRLVSRSSDRSYNSTDSSLNTVNSVSFLTSMCSTIKFCRLGTHVVGRNYVIACNATTTLHSCGYSSSVAVVRVHMHAHCFCIFWLICKCAEGFAR